MEGIKPVRFPVEPWTITEKEFRIEDNYRNETIFAQSNGYIGTRGTFEEAYPFVENEGLEGNFINGFYESGSISYGEWNYGFPEKSQTILNLPNLKGMRLYAGEEEFTMLRGSVDEYERSLHMDRGLVTRSLVWTTESGKRLKIQFERLVSLVKKNVMAERLSVTPLNYEGELRIVSVLDADVENHTRVTNPLVDYGPFGRRLLKEKLEGGETVYYEGKTKSSGLTMACGMAHRFSEEPAETLETLSGLHAERGFRFKARPGKTVTADKFIWYTSDLDMDTGCLEKAVKEGLEKSLEEGWESLAERQEEAMRAYWKDADVLIEGDDALQQGIRFNLYHLMQAGGRDGKTGLGAKGLTGEGYEGHYFWDTEVYVLPAFIYTAPALARKLLEYRYATLGQARRRARQLGHEKGALYPWRTINGEEASSYFPLGTAQYHINADIAYAFKLYVLVTGDLEFLLGQAAEVIIETARVWADVGCFSEARGGKYCICSVTGPDEYTALVDNNFYTNLMARENLKDAFLITRYLEKEQPLVWRRLKDKLGLEEEEAGLWGKIADNMYLPYDEEKGVYLQDDGFLLRKPWDDSRIPPEKRHLLYENYHPLFIYRQRMAKQADSIMGMYLYREYFTQEELQKNYDFYQQVTLHHSSLSTCIFGIMASRIGRREEAYRYFIQSARMDLDDYHENVYAGIHAANMAGTWQAIIYGFAGLSAGPDRLSLAPYAPEGWKSYQFHIRWRDCAVQVTVGREKCRVCLLSGSRLRMKIFDREIILEGEGDAHEEKL